MQLLSKIHGRMRSAGLGILTFFALAGNSPAVVVTNFSPVSAAPGEVVTISGSGFSTTLSDNVVYFGALRGSVIDPSSATSLSAVVPIGATYAPITVTVTGQVASTSQSFQPTFSVNSNNLSTSTFAPRVDLPASSGPIFTSIADLDGDGKPDLIVNNAYDHSFSLYRNITASGTLTTNSFASRVDVAVGGSPDNPYGQTVADVDGDGKLDVLICDRIGNKVSIYRNTSSPGAFTTNTLAARFDLTVGSDPRHVAVADLNDDGKPDIVSANWGGNNISILQNAGGPGNLAFSNKVDVATASGAYDLGIADLDGDGKLDIAVLATTSVSLFRNLGAGGTLSASSFQARIDLANGSGSGVGLAIGDMDGDGKPDLLTTSYLAQTISVFRNISTSGTLTNSFAARVEFLPGCRGHTLALGDLNGDKKADVSFVGEIASKLALYQNISTISNFTTSSLATRVDYGTAWNAWGVSAGDLDSDGRPDLVFCNSYSTSISLYRNALPWTGDDYLALDGVTPGSAVTINVLSNGTYGSFGEWAFESGQDGSNFAIGTNLITLHSAIKIGSTVYTPSTTTRSIALDLTYPYSYLTRWFLVSNPAERTKRMTVSGFVKFGPAPVQNHSDLYDTFSIYCNGTGGAYVMQLKSGDQNYYGLSIESNVDGTEHSADIPIAQNTIYWCCLRGDFANGVGQLAVYETVNWTLVGAVSIKTSATGQDVAKVRIGHGQSSTSPGDITYFENIIFDGGNAAFPSGL